MRVLAHNGKIAACEYSGHRYDMGNKLGILEASIKVALSREDLKDETAKLVKKIAERL